MHILVTGCAGFIGSHVTEALLKQGDTVTGIDNFDDFYDHDIKHKNISASRANENFTLYINDLTDSSLLLDHIFRHHEFDAICHLAARAGVRPSIESPLVYQQNNVLATTNLLELAVKHGIDRFVFASSSSVYGDSALEYEALVEEDDALADYPISPYAASKRACELIGYTYHHLYDITFTALRFFTVYGPRQRPEMAIHKFTRNIMNGEKIFIFGDGESSRDYTYIDDCVDGVLAAIDQSDEDKANYRIYNIGGDQPIVLNDLIKLIEEETGKKATTERISDQPGDVLHTVADITNASNDLMYMPKVSMEEGIHRFVEWIRYG